MKKSFIGVLILALCLSLTLPALAQSDYTVGGVVTMGRYEQDNNAANGKEPVEWQVLEVKEDQALLISRLCLDARAFNQRFIPMTWAECDLRAWMNDVLFNELFTAEEQAQVLPTEVVNLGNTHYGTYGGEDTVDKLYLLSLYEVTQYLPQKADRACAPTAYAVANGAYVNKENGNTWWILRTPGNRQIDICGVSADGGISGYGSRDVNRASGTLRPVMWVKITE